ncbi:ankyrin repeat and LEM domain-containing protein 1 [Erethizon dorsatum]
MSGAQDVADSAPFLTRAEATSSPAKCAQFMQNKHSFITEEEPLSSPWHSRGTCYVSPPVLKYGSPVDLPARHRGCPGSRGHQAPSRMWTPLRRRPALLGTLCTVVGLRPRTGGGAAHAHSAAAGSWNEAAPGPGRRLGGDTGAAAGEMGAAAGDTGTAAGDTDTAARLARQLRAALVQEEPRAVEVLLTRGADPNLVLEDGAAPLHLAARARGRRGLCCLGALLRRGADPNARSAEALTPLHVAAAWGCRRGLELLLRHGANPALRDQDGLRPLDLAEQQGHGDCARVLRGLCSLGCPASATASVTTGTRVEGGCGASLRPLPVRAVALGLQSVTLEPASWQAQPVCGDMGLGPSQRVASPTDPLEAADEDEDSESYPLGDWDSNSNEASFVTAVEVSGSEDTALERNSVGAWSLPQAEHGPMRAALRPTGRPGPSGKEAELGARLWAMPLSPSSATFFPPLLDADTSHSSPQEPSFCSLADEQLSLCGDMAALWLTEDEASTAEDRDLVPTCKLQPVPATPGLQLLHSSPSHPFSSSLTQFPLLGPDFSKYSPELAEALRTGCIPDSQADEDMLAQQFKQPNPSKRWCGGITKSSFTYLLLDPRETQDLPARAFSLTPAQRLQTFVRAIFYVGKGTRSRPDIHLWEALGYHGQPGRQACPKVRRILDIWDSGHGVVSLHCFQHVVAVEAYTREACLVDALGVQTLTNQKQGHYYGTVVTWPEPRRRRLGVHLLHRALLIFLAEGERELRPEDIQAQG